MASTSVGGQHRPIRPAPARSGLHQVTIRALKMLSLKRPLDENDWYPSWNDALKLAFPSSKGYMIGPASIIYREDNEIVQQRITDKGQRGEYRSPDFVVLKERRLANRNISHKIVLLVEIKNSTRWDEGSINKLKEQVIVQAEFALKDSSNFVHYLAAIGPHWQYGVKRSDRLDLDVIMDWRYGLHTLKAWQELEELARLVEAAHLESN